MEAVEAYKYLGVVYFAVIWAAILYILLREPHDKSKTVSRHVAAYKETFVMFAIVRTVVLPLWVLFAFGWLIPMLDLPMVASVLFAASMGADLVSAWVPAVDGRKGEVHKWSVLASALMQAALCLLFIRSSHISGIASTIVRTDILLMVLAWLVFLVHKKSKDNYLYFQLSYFVFFDTAFLAAAFL
jgi:hypothetical protein